MLDFLIMSNDYFLLKDGSKQSHKLNLYKYANEMCLHYGSSIEGRNASVSYWLKKNRKLPLIVSIKESLFYICTRYLKEDDALLIAYHELIYYRKEKKGTRLYFKNNINILINEDIRIIRRQEKMLHSYIFLRNEYNKSNGLLRK